MDDATSVKQTAHMTARTVFILDEQPSYVIVRHDTGVFYRHQFGGLLCNSDTVQGYLVPVNAEHAIKAMDRLFVGDGRDQCGSIGHGKWTDEMRDRVIAAVETVFFFKSVDIERRTAELLAVDQNRVNEISEGWVPVITPDGEGIFIW